MKFRGDDFSGGRKSLEPYTGEIIVAERSTVRIFSRKIAMLFLEKASLCERGIGLLRGKPLKFRPLEMGDKRFPPLDYGAVTSGFFCLFLLSFHKLGLL